MNGGAPFSPVLSGLLPAVRVNVERFQIYFSAVSEAFLLASTGALFLAVASPRVHLHVVGMLQVMSLT